ncbi:hypothetical protein PSZ89_22935, partial [Shigella sonnei]|nr:hypothetical protein [Shigella sonnei]
MLTCASVLSFLTSSLNSQEKKELTHKLESIFNNT